MMHLTEEQLFDFAAGTLSASEQFALAQHVSECADCRSQTMLARSINAALASQPLVEPSKSFTPNLMGVIHLEPIAASITTAPVYTRYLWNKQLAFVGVFFLIAGLSIAPFFIPTHAFMGVSGISSDAIKNLSSALTRFFANPLTPLCLSAAIIVIAFSFFETLVSRSSRR